MPPWLAIVCGVVLLGAGVGVGAAVAHSGTTQAAGKPGVTTIVTVGPPPRTVTATTTPTKIVATHVVTQRVTYTPPPPAQLSEGLYVVGSDIQPGLYHTTGGSICYWARLSSLDTSNIIDNNEGSGPQTVQVLAGDKAFQIKGDCTFGRV